MLSGESGIVGSQSTWQLGKSSCIVLCRYAVTKDTSNRDSTSRFLFFFLTVCVCWSSLSLFSSWTLSSPSLGAIGVRACRLSRPDRSQEKRDPFLICQRTCRALFDLPDDLLFSSSLFSYTYPPLSFPTTTTTFFTLKKT